VTLKQTGELFPDGHDAGTLTKQISDQIHSSLLQRANVVQLCTTTTNRRRPLSL
jgi:hypothetical protein